MVREPRMWTMPAEPASVRRVTDRWGRVWERDDGRVVIFWRSEGMKIKGWGHLLADLGPLTEVRDDA